MVFRFYIFKVINDFGRFLLIIIIIVILWDFKIKTDPLILARSLYLVIIN